MLISCLCWGQVTGCGKPAVDLAQETGLSIRPATADQVIAAVKNAQGRAVLVNVWATWCQPCVEEFPDIMKLHHKYQDHGLKVVFVSADFDNQTEAAKAFLEKQGVDFATYQKSGKDMAFINTLDQAWSGALPATWIYDRDGMQRYFWEGRKDYAHFEKSVLDVLGH